MELVAAQVSIEVIIPWRAGCEWRERSLRTLLPRYRWPVTVAWAPAGAWCKAAAVMPAIEQSTAAAVIVADADCWTDGLDAAVAAVAAGAPWAQPHATVHRLTAAATDRVHDGAPLAGELEQPAYEGVIGGGFVVARRDVLLDVPLDARFLGWGQEDTSWGLALTTLAGEPWRGAADLFHLWHPPQSRWSRGRGSPASWSLYQRYRTARADPDAMRALIEEAAPMHLTLMTRPCTVARVAPDGGRDDYGNATDGRPQTTATRCELQQTTRGEGDQGEPVATGWRLFLPAGTLVDAGDTVEVDGIRYEVDGDPWRARSPVTGTETHVEATVTRTAGSGSRAA